MKNKIDDVRDHMFAALERLNDENLTPEQIDKEIIRAKAIAEVGKVVVESAKAETNFLKVTGLDPTGFIGTGGKESDTDANKLTIAASTSAVLGITEIKSARE